MALLEINKNPSEKELRQFAAIWFPAFFLLIGTIIARKWDLWNIVLPVWGVVALIAIMGVCKPRAMRMLFIGWMYAAFPIGWTISHLVLAATYFLVLTPIGWAMRALGRDPMQRKFDKQAASYWIKRDQTIERSRYFKQF